MVRGRPGGRPRGIATSFLPEEWSLATQTRTTGVVTLVDRIPVDRVPPGLEIFRTAVLVLQVVGVLPDVVAKHRVTGRLDDPGHQRVVLVRCGDHRKPAVRTDDDPGPA